VTIFGHFLRKSFERSRIYVKCEISRHTRRHGTIPTNATLGREGGGLKSVKHQLNGP